MRNLILILSFYLLSFNVKKDTIEINYKNLNDYIEIKDSKDIDNYIDNIYIENKINLMEFVYMKKFVYNYKKLP